MPKKAGIGKKSSKLDGKNKRRQQYLELKEYRYYIFRYHYNFLEILAKNDNFK